MTLLIIIGVLLLIILFFQVNSIIYLKNRAKRSFSVIDVFLKKRYDLIPNLVETVKGYAKYEEHTLEEVAKLRTSYDNGNIELGNKLNETYSSLIALVENYPELKASDNFLNLQKQLVKVEDEIQASRRLYVNDVTNYNTKIERIPNNIIALFIGAKRMELLSFDTEEINIKF